MQESPMPASRFYPAVDLTWSSRPDNDRLEILLADIDDEAPLGVEELNSGLRIYFSTAVARGRAAVRLVALAPDLICEPLEVSDENWAERSQASLGAVTVERFVIAPPWVDKDLGGRFPERVEKTTPEVISIVIQPSMGFGTGHHASTRLCLRLLQQRSVAGLEVLDVGTGSGILAIAAAKLGARRVIAIDTDADALSAARENVELNETGADIELVHMDVGAALDQAFDLILANLTGTALVRHAGELVRLLHPTGTLISSGFASDEEASVTTACVSAGLRFDVRAEEDGWVACAFVRG
jgi:ribosomal protein L11 methyltransferase